MKQLEAHWYAWSRYRPDRRLDEHVQRDNSIRVAAAKIGDHHAA